MKNKLTVMAVNHEITLFEEDEEPDPSILTPKMLQDIAGISLDLVSDLIQLGAQNPQETQTQIVEKVVNKTSANSTGKTNYCQ